MKFKSFIINHKKVFIALFTIIGTVGIIGGAIAYTHSQNQKQEELSKQIKELEKKLENEESEETIEVKKPTATQDDESVTQSEKEPIANNNDTAIDDTELEERIKEEVSKQLEAQQQENASSEKEDVVYSTSSEDDNTPPVKDEDKVEGTTDSSMPENKDDNSGVPDVNVPDSYN